MATVTFRKKIGGWTLLTENLKPQLPNMPDLAAQHADLEKTIADAQALANEQEDLRGKLKKTIQQRQALEKQGEDLRQRLSAALQSKLGFADAGLMTNGVVPKKKRVRSKKTVTQPAQPATATTTPASPTPQAQPPAGPVTK
jgi:hypothetical protein